MRVRTPQDADRRIGLGETGDHPASFVVIETARAKYACPYCHDGVVEAPAPPQAVEKSLAGEGRLAHVVVSKYVDHLPLHRLEGIFVREGIDLARTTLCGWVAGSRRSFKAGSGRIVGVLTVQYRIGGWSLLCALAGAVRQAVVRLDLMSQR